MSVCIPPTVVFVVSVTADNRNGVCFQSDALSQPTTGRLLINRISKRFDRRIEVKITVFFVIPFGRKNDPAIVYGSTIGMRCGLCQGRAGGFDSYSLDFRFQW